jgi:cellulose biosynthesis protein BcsQ
MSLRMLEQLVEFIQARVGEAALPFFSMVARRRSLHEELIDEARDRFPGILSTEVPYWSEIEKMAVRRAPIVAFAPRSPAAQVYEALWSEVDVRLQLARS